MEYEVYKYLRPVRASCVRVGIMARPSHLEHSSTSRRNPANVYLGASNPVPLICWLNTIDVY